MAYVAPTYADFIARFPIFGNTDTYPQSVVEAILVEATNAIDETWLETDYKPAIMYLAAHMLATDNSSEDTDVEFGPGPSFIQSESFAGMSTTYSKGSTDAAGQSKIYGSTVYGRRYYVLLQKNKPAVVVA